MTNKKDDKKTPLEWAVVIGSFIIVVVLFNYFF